MDDDFEQHKVLLFDLYMAQNRPLTRKLHAMTQTDALNRQSVQEFMKENHGFDKTKANYEAAIKEWGWKKYISKADWNRIAPHLRKRKQAGQDSEVIYHGTLIPQTTLDKNMKRYKCSDRSEVLDLPGGIEIKSPDAPDSIQEALENGLVIEDTGSEAWENDLVDHTAIIPALAGTTALGISPSSLEHPYLPIKDHMLTVALNEELLDRLKGLDLHNLLSQMIQPQNAAPRYLPFANAVRPADLLQSWLPRNTSISTQTELSSIQFLEALLFAITNDALSYSWKSFLVMLLSYPQASDFFQKLISTDQSRHSPLPEKIFPFALKANNIAVLRACITRVQDAELLSHLADIAFSSAQKSMTDYRDFETACSIFVTAKRLFGAQKGTISNTAINILQHAVKSKPLISLEVFLADGISLTPDSLCDLMTSMLEGSTGIDVEHRVLGIVVRLLEIGAATVRYHRSPLRLAILRGFGNIVQVLLKHNTKLTDKNVQETSKLQQGCTCYDSHALGWLVAYAISLTGEELPELQVFQNVCWLLEAGANINNLRKFANPWHDSHHGHPLDEAVKVHSVVLLDLLVQYQASPGPTFFRNATLCSCPDTITWIATFCTGVSILEWRYLIQEQIAQARPDPLEALKARVRHTQATTQYATGQEWGDTFFDHFFLTAALCIREKPLIDLLLALRAPLHSHAIILAIQENDEHLVHRLLDHRIRGLLAKDGTYHGEYACENENVIYSPTRNCALVAAIQVGNTPILQRVLYDGMCTGLMAALKAAIEANRTDVVAMILGSNPLRGLGDLCEVLVAAVLQESVNLVKAILHWCHDQSSRDFQWHDRYIYDEPLFIALRLKNRAIIEEIFKYASILAPDRINPRQKPTQAIDLHDLDFVRFVLELDVIHLEYSMLLEAVKNMNFSCAVVILEYGFRKPGRASRRAFIQMALELAEERFAPAPAPLTYCRLLCDRILSVATEYECNKLLKIVVLHDVGPHYEIVTRVLEAGAHPDHVTDVNPVRHGKRIVGVGKRIVDLFSYRMTILGYAAYTGNVPLLKLFLKYKASTECRARGYTPGLTPLQVACAGGHHGAIELLLKNHANANAPASPQCGATAMQFAAASGVTRHAELLLESGADVNARPSLVGGFAALEGAAEFGRIDMVSWLLQNGVLISGDYEWQYNRAVAAARKNNHHAIKSLLMGWKASTELHIQSLPGPSWLPTVEDEQWDQNFDLATF